MAEFEADFNRLLGKDESLEATEYHPLVPNLAVSHELAAVLAVQITLFPNCGTIIKDPTGLDAIFTKQWKDLDCGPNNRSLVSWEFKEVASDSVRGTFHLTQEIDDNDMILGFPADDRPRLEPPVPETYFGNCLRGKIVAAYAKGLVDKDGLDVAVKSIGEAIKSLDIGSVLDGAESWVSRSIGSSSSRRREPEVRGTRYTLLLVRLGLRFIVVIMDGEDQEKHTSFP
ncbi:Transferase [Trema orientale]|uniref:Transferase n=1 Tax=Trema orientale TaxID=63057 RepID=A0A2P5DK32_TREOI|nr:Transferase [Trema orientale]